MREDAHPFRSPGSASGRVSTGEEASQRGRRFPIARLVCPCGRDCDRDFNADQWFCRPCDVVYDGIGLLEGGYAWVEATWEVSQEAMRRKRRRQLVDAAARYGEDMHPSVMHALLKTEFACLINTRFAERRYRANVDAMLRRHGA